MSHIIKKVLITYLSKIWKKSEELYGSWQRHKFNASDMVVTQNRQRSMEVHIKSEESGIPRLCLVTLCKIKFQFFRFRKCLVIHLYFK